MLGLGAGVFGNGVDCDSEIIREINGRAVQFQNLIFCWKIAFLLEKLNFTFLLENARPYTFV